MNIQLAESDAAIRACFPVFSELRPHLDEETFVTQVKRQMQNHGYVLVCVVHDGKVVAGAGYRVMESLSWGKALYLDDLITLKSERNHGYGGALLDRVIDEAKASGCRQFHLDSGVHRHEAHRLYMSRKLQIGAFHFSKDVE